MSEILKNLIVTRLKQTAPMIAHMVDRASVRKISRENGTSVMFMVSTAYYADELQSVSHRTRVEDAVEAAAGPGVTIHYVIAGRV